MIHLWRDPLTGQYGLRQFERPDGTWGHFAEIDDDVKPDLIDDHGTMVLLLGNEPEDDTMRAPVGAPSPSRWIAKYLNTRFNVIPEGITIRVREGWEQPRNNVDTNHLRTLVGQARYLEQHAAAAGQVALTGGVANWWILKDETATTSNSGWIESAGHTAALYQGELYELSTGRAGRAQLQNFGIIFGTPRVVVYVEPDQALAITTNTARTQLLAGSEPLPWADWAAEFSTRIPQPLQDLMDEVAAGSSATDHTKAIRDRLREIFDLFKVTRYRPAANGAFEVDTESTVRGGRPRRVGPARPRTGQRRGGGQGGAAGGIYASFLRDGGTPADGVRTDGFPDVRWVSVSDGTREQGDIEDRAARYLPQTNTLLVNADFRVFADMVDHWKRELGTAAAAGPQVVDAVHNWFEQALVETVLGVQALKDSKEWPVTDIQAALSEEALTAGVMQRYHVNNAVKRELGAKLGRLSRLATADVE